MKLFAPCESGLEPVLADELMAIGGRDVTPVRRGVSFTGTKDTIWRANLQCRTANRVLVELLHWGAKDREQLYNGARGLRWSDWFDNDCTLAVDSVVKGEIASQFANQVVKDAICDHFRMATGARPSVDRHNPDVPVSLHLVDGVATLSLDSSGSRLHRRGYRAGTGEAPLKETLAAGIIALTGWDGRSPLLDPMCGSGTLLIEAAMMSRGMPPGGLRSQSDGWAFERWRDHDGVRFNQLVRRLLENPRRSAEAPIYGFDVEPFVLDCAERGSERAGVRADITFAKGTVERVEAPAESGTLVCNPPYGVRIGETEELGDLYEAFGNTLKRQFSGWTAWILCGDKALEKRIGLRASKRIALFNGAIECRLLRFDLYSGSKKASKQPKQETEVT